MRGTLIDKHTHIGMWVHSSPLPPTQHRHAGNDFLLDYFDLPEMDGIGSGRRRVGNSIQVSLVMGWNPITLAFTAASWGLHRQEGGAQGCS